MRFLLLQGTTMRPSNYWGIFVLLIISSFINNFIPDPILYFAFSLSFYYLQLCAACARLRDAGKSARRVLLAVIPITIGVPTLLVAQITDNSFLAGIGGTLAVIGGLIAFIGTIVIGCLPSTVSPVPAEPQQGGDQPKGGVQPS